MEVRQFWIAHAGLLVYFLVRSLIEVMGEREEEDEKENGDRDIPSGRQSCGMVDWVHLSDRKQEGGSVIGYIRHRLLKV